MRGGPPLSSGIHARRYSIPLGGSRRCGIPTGTRRWPLPPHIPPEICKNGLVFCHVNSWLTGHRLVSLPFSDHCEPLCDSAKELNFLVRYLQSVAARQGWKYVELRPVDQGFAQNRDGSRFAVASKYFFHSLSLCPDLDQLFRGLDKDSVQRRIGRAERAGLEEKCGRSEELLKAFYSLSIATEAGITCQPCPTSGFKT